jgi:hypothetical protein
MIVHEMTLQKMTQMIVEEMTIDKMIVEEMTIGKMTKMNVEEITIDKMTNECRRND